MEFIRRYKFFIFSALFIIVFYFLITYNALSHYIILFFILPLMVIEYKDFEIRFFFFLFVFLISLMINKFSHMDDKKYLVYNFLSFLSLFFYSIVKNSGEKGNIKENEMSERRIIELKKEIDDIRSKIDFYLKHKETLLSTLDARKKVISLLKPIYLSKTNDEIVRNLIKSIMLTFPDVKVEFIISPGNSKVVEDVFKSKLPIYIPSLSRENRYNRSYFSQMENSIIYLPVLFFSRVIGVVKVFSDEDGRFSSSDFRTIELFTALASTSMENLSLYARTEELARKDPLTNAFTRKAFEEKLDEEILVSARTQKPLSLLMFDIDHFKHINDTYGHQAGDEVLKTLGRITIENVREFDFVARYGGEEFCVIMPYLSKSEGVLVAERLRSIVKSLEFESNGSKFKITLSMGLSEFPLEATSKAQLIRRSDERLYKAKNSGRDRIVYE